MAIPPPNPYRCFRCETCGWSHTFLQRTDEMEFFRSCPKCHADTLRFELTLTGELYEQYLRWRRKIFPRTGRH
jgi:NAD-dependent SIR2 family protein deacetylase